MNLTKGENITLTKGTGLRQLAIGLGWKAKTAGDSADLDAMAFLLTANGKVISDKDGFCYFNNKKLQGVESMGDNLVGGDGAIDSEQIMIDLDQVPPSIDKIAVAVSIYKADEKHQNFGLVEKAFIRAYDRINPSNVLAKFDLTEDIASSNAVIMGEIYRHEGEWKFRAIGEGLKGGTKELATRYGVSV
jgi:tellurium resistance protein TerD